MKYIIIIIIMMLLTSPSCKKTSTQQQLPPETHAGKFTFGCKVDGKIYTASGKDGILTSQYVSYGLISSDSSIYISARNTNNPNFGFTMKIHYLGQIGSHLMKTYPYEGIFSDNSNGSIPGSSNTFTTTNNYIGSINIKFFNGLYSPYNKGTVLAGTFEMDAVNGEGKVIHITEGRYDIGPE